MFFIAFCLLNYLLPCCNMLAQPKGFTDDPYVNDEKFIEKGNSIHNSYNIWFFKKTVQW